MENKFLRDIQHEDIETLRNFRNREDVSVFMHDKTYITKEMQEKWFLNILHIKNQIHKVFIVNNEICGMINFKKLDTNKPEWGFYNIKKGEGYDLMKLGLQFWVTHFPAKALFAEILKSNTKSLHLHLKCNFKIIKDTNDIIELKYENYG